MGKKSHSLYILAVKHDEVARVLSEWFNLVDGMCPRERSEIWSRSSIGCVIRDRLRGLGYWKNRSRGDPRKGYSVSRFGVES